MGPVPSCLGWGFRPLLVMTDLLHVTTGTTAPTAARAAAATKNCCIMTASIRSILLAWTQNRGFGESASECVKGLECKEQ